MGNTIATPAILIDAVGFAFIVAAIAFAWFVPSFGSYFSYLIVWLSVFATLIAIHFIGLWNFATSHHLTTFAHTSFPWLSPKSWFVMATFDMKETISSLCMSTALTGGVMLFIELLRTDSSALLYSSQTLLQSNEPGFDNTKNAICVLETIFEYVMQVYFIATNNQAVIDVLLAMDGLYQEAMSFRQQIRQFLLTVWPNVPQFCSGLTASVQTSGTQTIEVTLFMICFTVLLLPYAAFREVRFAFQSHMYWLAVLLFILLFAAAVFIWGDFGTFLIGLILLTYSMSITTTGMMVIVVVAVLIAVSFCMLAVAGLSFITAKRSAASLQQQIAVVVPSHLSKTAHFRAAWASQGLQLCAIALGLSVLVSFMGLPVSNWQFALVGAPKWPSYADYNAYELAFFQSKSFKDLLIKIIQTFTTMNAQLVAQLINLIPTNWGVNVCVPVPLSSDVCVDKSFNFLSVITGDASDAVTWFGNQLASWEADGINAIYGLLQLAINTVLNDASVPSDVKNAIQTFEEQLFSITGSLLDDIESLYEVITRLKDALAFIPAVLFWAPAILCGIVIFAAYVRHTDNVVSRRMLFISQIVAVLDGLIFVILYFVGVATAGVLLACSLLLGVVAAMHAMYYVQHMSHVVGTMLYTAVVLVIFEALAVGAAVYFYGKAFLLEYGITFTFTVNWGTLVLDVVTLQLLLVGSFCLFTLEESDQAFHESVQRMQHIINEIENANHVRKLQQPPPPAHHRYQRVAEHDVDEAAPHTITTTTPSGKSVVVMHPKAKLYVTSKTNSDSEHSPASASASDS